jgi:hypothetical protein
MDLLAVGTDSKTPRGLALRVLTGICYLQPADESGDGVNLCSHYTAACKAVCINVTGRGIFPSVQRGRARKRALFVSNRLEFLRRMDRDLSALERKARRLEMTPGARMNGTSDVAWELIAPALFSGHPDTRFYDYTKVPARMTRYLAGKLPPNYSLTFSRSDKNEEQALGVLAMGGNVAVVFGTPRGAALPSTWHGYRVVDGDASDVRFLDPAGVVVGLRAKGGAKKDATGFVVRGMTPALAAPAGKRG